MISTSYSLIVQPPNIKLIYIGSSAIETFGWKLEVFLPLKRGVSNQYNLLIWLYTVLRIPIDTIYGKDIVSIWYTVRQGIFVGN